MDVHEFNAIKDEDLLRRLWQETEDFGRKKEIRARMYKLREARLREFYTTDMDTSDFSKTPITSRHGESMADQSFEHLKTKEIRDCASPIRENKFGISLPTDTSGWNITTTAESSADGKANRVHSFATTDGVRNVQGGQTAFTGRNEQTASDKYEGDDRNYTHSMGDSAKSMLQENTVIGDPNNRFTQNKSTAETSSTYVVKSQKLAPESGDGSSYTSTSSTEKFESQNVVKQEFVKTSKQSYIIDGAGNRQLVDGEGFSGNQPGRFIDNSPNNVERSSFLDNANSTSSRTVTSNVKKIHEDTLHNITNKTFGQDQDRNRYASASTPDNSSRPASASPYNTNSPATANTNTPASPHDSGPSRGQTPAASAHGFDDNNQKIPNQTHNIPITTNANNPQRPDLSREPARVQEAFRLAEQPGTVISRKVEYPNERTVCITETKRLDDGTTVTTKRYETKGNETNQFSNTLRTTNERPGDKSPYAPVDKDVEYVTNRPKTDNERHQSVKKDLGNDKYVTEKKYYVDDVKDKPAGDLKKPQPAAQQPYTNRKISMEVDAAHDAFARSLRCVSPIDNRGSNKSLRSNSTYDKSRLTKGRRSNSRDTVTSDVSKISTNTVTKHDAPKEYDFMRPTITSEIRSSTKTPERQLSPGKRPSRPIDENEQFLVRERAPELAHEQPDDRSPTGRPKERPLQKSPLQGRPAPSKATPTSKHSKPEDLASDDEDDDDLYVEEIDIILEVNDRGEITSPRRSVSPNKPGEVKNRRPTPASPGPRGISPNKPESRIKKITTTTIEETHRPRHPSNGSETSPSKLAPGKKPSEYKQPAGKKPGFPESTDGYPNGASPRDYSPDALKPARKPSDDNITSINLKSTIKSPNGNKPGDDHDGPKPRGVSPDYRYPGKNQPREASPGKQAPSQTRRKPQNEYPDQPGTIISRKIVKVDDTTVTITEIIRLVDRTRVTVRRFAPNDDSHKPIRETAPDTHEPYRPQMRKPDESDSVPVLPGTIISRKITIIDENTISIIEIVRLVDGTRVTIKRFAPNDGTYKEIHESNPDTYEPYESLPTEDNPRASGKPRGVSPTGEYPRESSPNTKSPSRPAAGGKSPFRCQSQHQYPEEPGTIISRKIVVIDEQTVTITEIIRLVSKTRVTIRRFAPNDGTHKEILESRPDTYEDYTPKNRKPAEPEGIPRKPGTIVSRKITEIDDTTISVTEIIVLIDRTRVTVRRFAPNDDTLEEIDESEPDTYEPFEPTSEDDNLREGSPVTRKPGQPGRHKPIEKSPSRPGDSSKTPKGLSPTRRQTDYPDQPNRRQPNEKSPSRPNDTSRTPKASSPGRRPDEYPDQPGKIVSRKVVDIDEATVSITEVIRLVDRSRVTIRRFAPNDGTHKEILESRPDTYEAYAPKNRKPSEPERMPRKPGTIVSRKITEIDDTTISVTEIIVLIDRTRVTVRRYAPNDDTLEEIDESEPDTYEPFEPTSENEYPTSNLREGSPVTRKPGQPGQPGRHQPIEKSPSRPSDSSKTPKGLSPTRRQTDYPDQPARRQPTEKSPSRPSDTSKTPKASSPGRRPDEYPDQPGKIVSRKVVDIDEATVSITEVIRLVDRSRVTIRRFAPNDGTHKEILESRPDTYEAYAPKNRKPSEPEGMARKPGTIVSRKITEIDDTTISVTEIIVLIDRTRVTVRRYAPNDDTLEEIDESEPDTYEPFEPTSENEYPTSNLREGSPVTRKPGQPSRHQPNEKSPSRPSDSSKTPKELSPTRRQTDYPDQPARRQPTEKSPSRPSDTSRTPKASSPGRRPDEYPDQPGKIVSRKVVDIDEATVSITEVIRLVDRSRVTIRRFAPNDGTHKEILESRPDTYEAYAPKNRKPSEPEGMPRKPGTIVSRKITEIDDTTISVTEIIVLIDRTRVTVRRYAPNDDTLEEIDESEPDTYEPFEPTSENEYPTSNLREGSPVTRKPGQPSRHQPNEKSPSRPSDSSKTPKELSPTRRQTDYPDQPARRQPTEKSPSRPSDTSRTPKASSPGRRPDEYPDQPGKIVSRKVVDIDEATVSITEVIRLVDRSRVTIRRFAPNDGTHKEILESRPDTYEAYAPKNRKPSEPEGMPRKPGTIVSRKITEIDDTTISVTEIIVLIDRTRVTVRRYAPNDDTLEEIDESEPDTYEPFEPTSDNEYPTNNLREGSPVTRKPGQPSRHQPNEKSPSGPSDSSKTPKELSPTRRQTDYPDQPARRQPTEKSPSRPSDTSKTPKASSPGRRPSDYPDQPGTIISRKVVVIDDSTVSITEIIRLVDQTQVTIRRFAPNNGTHREISESWPDSYEPYEPSDQTTNESDQLPQKPGTVISRKITVVDETTICITEIIRLVDKTRLTVKRFVPNDDTLEEIDESEPDTYEPYEVSPTRRQPDEPNDRSPVRRPVQTTSSNRQNNKPSSPDRKQSSKISPRDQQPERNQPDRKYPSKTSLPTSAKPRDESPEVKHPSVIDKKVPTNRKPLRTVDDFQEPGELYPSKKTSKDEKYPRDESPDYEEEYPLSQRQPKGVSPSRNEQDEDYPSRSPTGRLTSKPRDESPERSKKYPEKNNPDKDYPRYNKPRDESPKSGRKYPIKSNQHPKDDSPDRSRAQNDKEISKSRETSPGNSVKYPGSKPRDLSPEIARKHPTKSNQRESPEANSQDRPRGTSDNRSSKPRDESPGDSGKYTTKCKPDRDSPTGSRPGYKPRDESPEAVKGYPDEKYPSKSQPTSIRQPSEPRGEPEALKLAKKPGTVVSRQIDVVDEETVQITEIKLLLDGTRVKTKRYEPNDGTHREVRESSPNTYEVDEESPDEENSLGMKPKKMSPRESSPSRIPGKFKQKSPEPFGRKFDKSRDESPEPEEKYPRELYPDQPGTIISRRIVKIDETTISITEIIRLVDGTKVTTKRYAPNDESHKEIYENEPRTHEPYEPDDESEEPGHVREAFRLAKKPGTIISRKIVTIDDKTVSITEIKRLLDGTTITTKRYEPNDGTHKEIRKNSPKDHELFEGQPGEPTEEFPDEPGTIISRKVVIIDTTTVSITEIIRLVSRTRVTIRRFAPNDGTHKEICESEPDTYEPYEPEDIVCPEPEHFKKSRRLAQKPGSIISRKIINIDDTVIAITEVKRLEDGTLVTINRFAPNDKTFKDIREPSPIGTRPKSKSPYVEDDPSPRTSPVPQYNTTRKSKPEGFETSPESGIPTRKPIKEQLDGGRFTKPRVKDNEPVTSSRDSSPDYKTNIPRRPPGFETEETPVRRSPRDRSEPEESSRDSSPVTKRPTLNKPHLTVTEHSETDDFEEIRKTVKKEKSPIPETKIPAAIRTSPKRDSSPEGKLSTKPIGGKPISGQTRKPKPVEYEEDKYGSKPSSRDTSPENRKSTKGKVVPDTETDDYDEPKVSTTSLKMKPVKQTSRPDEREPDRMRTVCDDSEFTSIKKSVPHSRDSSPDGKVCGDSEFKPTPSMKGDKDKPRTKKITEKDSIDGDSSTEDDTEQYVRETMSTKHTVSKTINEDEKYFRKPDEKRPDDDKFTPDSPNTTRRETYEERCKRIIGVPDPRDQSPNQPKDAVPKTSEIRERKMLIRRETQEMEKVTQTTVTDDTDDDGPTRGSPVKKPTSTDDFLNFEKQAIEAEKTRALRKSPEKLGPVGNAPRSSTPYIEDEEEPVLSSRDSSPDSRRSKPNQPLIKTKFNEETNVTTKKVISKTTIKPEPEKPKALISAKSSVKPTNRDTSPHSKTQSHVAKTSEAFINLEKKGSKPETTHKSPKEATPTKKNIVTGRKDTAPVHPTSEREKPMQRAASENPMRHKNQPSEQVPTDEYPDQSGTIISRQIVTIDRYTVVITEIIRLVNRTLVTVRRFAPNDRTHKEIQESEPESYEVYEPKLQKVKPDDMPQKPGTIISRKITVIDEITISILEIIILVDKTRVTVRRFAPNDDTLHEIDESKPDTYEIFEVMPNKYLPNKNVKDKMPTPSPYKTKPVPGSKPHDSSKTKYQPQDEYPDQAGTIISRKIVVVERTTVSITEIIRLINKTRVTVRRFAPNDGTHKEIKESEPVTYEKYNPRNRKPTESDSLPQKPGTIISRKITYIDEVTISVTEIIIVERTRFTVRRYAPNDGTLEEIDESEPNTYEPFEPTPGKIRPTDKNPRKSTQESSPTRGEPQDEYPDQPGTIISRKIVVINIKTVSITEIIRLVNKTRVIVKRTAPNDGTHKEIRESEPKTYESYEPAKIKPIRRPSQKNETQKAPSGEKSPIRSELLENIEIEVEHIKTTKTDEKVKRNSLVSISSTDEYTGKPRYPDLIHEPEDESPKRKPAPKVQNIPIFEEETNDYIGLRIEEVEDSGDSDTRDDETITKSSVTDKISKFTKKVEEISNTNLRSPKSPKPESPTRSKFSPTSKITDETSKKTSKTYHSETSETYEEDECLLSVSQKVNRFTTKAEKLEPTAPQKSPELVKNAVRKSSKPGFAPDSPTAITKRKLNESVERLEETTNRSRERKSVEKETPEEPAKKLQQTKDKTYKDRKESASTLIMRSTEAVKRAKEIFENKTSPQKQSTQPKQKDILSRPSVFEEKRKTSRIQSDVSDVESIHEQYRTTERRTSVRKQYLSDDNDEIYERSSSRESGHTPSYMRQTISSIEHMKRRTSIDGNQTIVETEQLTINTIPQGKNLNNAPSIDDANIEEIFDLETLENMLEAVVGYEQRRRIRAQIRVVKKIVEDHLNKPSTGKKQPQETATKAPLRRPSAPDNNTTTKTTRTIRNEGNKIIDEKVKTTERRRQSGLDTEHEVVKTSTIIKKTNNVSPTRKSSDTTPESPSRRNSRPKAEEPSPLKTRPSARYPYSNQKSIDAEKNKQNRPREPEKPTPKTNRTQDFIQTEREATRQQTTKVSRSPSPKASHVSTTSKTVEKTTFTKTPETTRKVVTKDRYVTDSNDSKPVWANAKNILKTPSARPEQPKTPTATRKVDPKSYRMPDYNSDDITSSYGIGPTDENGLPMFGLRALKKKTATPTTTSKVSGSIVTESFYSENGATPTGERKTIVYSTDANDLPENLPRNDRTPSEIRDSLIEKSSRGKISSVTTKEKFGKTDNNQDDNLEMGSRGSGAKVVRRGSVKKLTEKFTNKTSSVETNSPSGTYPKAGLILRSKSQSSQSSNPDLSRDDGVEFDESDVELRSQVTRRETTTKRYSSSSFQDDDDRHEQSSRSSKTRSFLNDGSKVTGAYDIIDRMRNADNVREAGDTEDDKEARALLNKFLGASILMSGVESSMASSMSSSNEKLPNTSSKSGNKSKVTKRTVKVTRSGGDNTTETIDFEDIWDENLLRQLLEASTNIEERRIIRARLNQIMADREACADVIASVTADLHSQHLDSASNVEGESLLLPLLQGLLSNKKTVQRAVNNVNVGGGGSNGAGEGRSGDQNSFLVVEDSGTESGEDLRLLAAGLHDNIELQRADNRKQSANSSNDSKNMLDEVTTALQRLETSLREGKDINLDRNKKNTLLTLVSRLQQGLLAPENITAPTPIPSKESPEPPENVTQARRGSARFAKRRNRQNRHTVGVSREELADARRVIEEMVMIKNLTNLENASPEKVISAEPEFNYVLQKQASTSALYGVTPTNPPPVTLMRPNQFVPKAMKDPQTSLEKFDFSRIATDPVAIEPSIHSAPVTIHMRPRKPKYKAMRQSISVDTPASIFKYQPQLNSFDTSTNLSTNAEKQDSSSDEDNGCDPVVTATTAQPLPSPPSAPEKRDSLTSDSTLESKSPQKSPNNTSERRPAANKFNSKKQRMKRANTIDIPKALNLKQEPDTDDEQSGSDNEKNYHMDLQRLKTTVQVADKKSEIKAAPAFIPKTENDQKFVAFLQKQSNNNALSWQNPSFNDNQQRLHKGGHNWNSKFDHLKQNFEKGNAGDLLVRKPPAAANSAMKFWKKVETKDPQATQLKLPPPVTKPVQKQNPPKLPWTEKTKRIEIATNTDVANNVVVGTLNISNVPNKTVPNKIVVPQPVTINQFSHAPQSVFKPVPKVFTPPAAIFKPIVPEVRHLPTNIQNGHVKQMATAGYKETPFVPAPKPAVSPTRSIAQIQPPQLAAKPTSPSTILPWAGKQADHRVMNIASSKFENSTSFPRETGTRPPRSPISQSFTYKSKPSTLVESYKSSVDTNTSKLFEKRPSLPDAFAGASLQNRPVPSREKSTNLIGNFVKRLSGTYDDRVAKAAAAAAAAAKQEISASTKTVIYTITDYTQPSVVSTFAPVVQPPVDSLTDPSAEPLVLTSTRNFINSTIKPDNKLKVCDHTTPDTLSPLSHSEVEDDMSDSTEYKAVSAKVMKAPVAQTAVTMSKKPTRRHDDDDEMGGGAMMKGLQASLKKISGKSPTPPDRAQIKRLSHNLEEFKGTIQINAEPLLPKIEIKSPTTPARVDLPHVIYNNTTPYGIHQNMQRQVMEKNDHGEDVMSMQFKIPFRPAPGAVAPLPFSLPGQRMDTSQESTTTEVEEKDADDGSVTTTKRTVTTTRTMSSNAPKKPMSPFAKFQQLEKQNSITSPSNSPKLPSTPSSPMTPSSPGGGQFFKFTDPDLNRKAATVKDQLLQWCQMKTKEYENIQITNFSSCWSDGLAFCALIHHFLPDAFDYSQLTPKQRRYNFDLAFRVADEKAGIAPLLDVEDMVVMRKPDWKCVFTYVQSIYRRFRNED